MDSTLAKVLVYGTAAVASAATVAGTIAYYQFKKEMQSLEAEKKKRKAKKLAAKAHAAHSLAAKAAKEKEHRDHLIDELCKGNAHLSAGALDAAIKLYTKALAHKSCESNPDVCKQLLLQRAMALIELTRYRDAMKDADLALKIDFRSAPAHCIRGCCLKRLDGDEQEDHAYEDAYEEFDLAVSIDPHIDGTFTSSKGEVLSGPARMEMNEMLMELGNRYIASGKFERARKYFTKLLKNEPHHPKRGQIWASRALCHLKSAEDELALRDAQRIMELDNDTQGHFLAATALMNLGRFDEAITEFDYVLAREPERHTAIQFRQKCQQSKEKAEAARVAHERHLQAEQAAADASVQRMAAEIVQTAIDHAVRTATTAADATAAPAGAASAAATTADAHLEQLVASVVQTAITEAVQTQSAAAAAAAAGTGAEQHQQQPQAAAAEQQEAGAAAQLVQ